MMDGGPGGPPAIPRHDCDSLVALPVDLGQAHCLCRADQEMVVATAGRGGAGRRSKGSRDLTHRGAVRRAARASPLQLPAGMDRENRQARQLEWELALAGRSASVHEAIGHGLPAVFLINLSLIHI